jgi:hypothetical protein
VSLFSRLVSPPGFKFQCFLIGTFIGSDCYFKAPKICNLGLKAIKLNA